MMVARWFSDDFSSLSEYLRPGTPHHQVVIIVLKPPTIFYSILPIMASSLPMGSAAFPKSNLHLKFLRNGQAKSSSIGFVVEETLFLSPRFPDNLIQNWGKFIPGLLNWIYNPDLFHENLHQVLLTGGFFHLCPIATLPPEEPWAWVPSGRPPPRDSWPGLAWKGTSNLVPSFLASKTH